MRWADRVLLVAFVLFFARTVGVHEITGYLTAAAFFAAGVAIVAERLINRQRVRKPR
jgi:hypothetical protein